MEDHCDCDNEDFEELDQIIEERGTLLLKKLGLLTVEGVFSLKEKVTIVEMWIDQDGKQSWWPAKFIRCSSSDPSEKKFEFADGERYFVFDNAPWREYSPLAIQVGEKYDLWWSGTQNRKKVANWFVAQVQQDLGEGFWRVKFIDDGHEERCKFDPICWRIATDHK